MVGGKVIEVSEVKTHPDCLFVDCADRPYNRIETCAILVAKDENALKIQIGDSLWWQCGHAMWTPQANIGMKNAKCGVDFDIKLEKRSGSGITHPDRATNNSENVQS